VQEDLNKPYSINCFLWSVHSPSAPYNFQRAMWPQSINDYSPPSGPTIFNSGYRSHLKSLRKSTQLVHKSTRAQLVNGTQKCTVFKEPKRRASELRHGHISHLRIYALYVSSHKHYGTHHGYP